MKNLVNVENPDETILEELYLANVTPIKVSSLHDERVKYSFIGKIGEWTLTRRSYYWSAHVSNEKFGLPLNIAMDLHNKKHPTKDIHLGKVIRSGGHCGYPSPDEYGAQPIYDEALDAKLEAIGYKKTYSKTLGREYIPITVGEVSKLCNEGKLDVERYVDCYHIDDQIGLNELVKVLVKFSKEKTQSTSVLDVIKAMPQQGQVQYDLRKQLTELRFAANKLGLYDAADFLRSYCEK